MSELNDPRVFFAAERTLLAWNRTGLALIGFGFVIERSGLLLRLVRNDAQDLHAAYVSFWIGLAFIFIGCGASVWSAREYRRVVRSLKPVEIPDGYSVNAGPAVNLMVAALGIFLALYLLLS